MKNSIFPFLVGILVGVLLGGLATYCGYQNTLSKQEKEVHFNETSTIQGGRTLDGLVVPFRVEIIYTPGENKSMLECQVRQIVAITTSQFSASEIVEKDSRFGPVLMENIMNKMKYHCMQATFLWDDKEGFIKQMEFNRQANLQNKIRYAIEEAIKTGVLKTSGADSAFYNSQEFKEAADKWNNSKNK